jgi:hypothetical protein
MSEGTDKSAADQAAAQGTGTDNAGAPPAAPEAGTQQTTTTTTRARKVKVVTSITLQRKDAKGEIENVAPGTVELDKAEAEDLVGRGFAAWPAEAKASAGGDGDVTVTKAGADGVKVSKAK